MYQIFVVEDELLIRQSIRNTIEKMQGPYVFCGEASDGEMALSMMQDLMPDILLTDIRMPFLDGFGLIRHARSMMPWLKIVIISGYGDFEFTQKAIALGVDQYLLKPVRPADLTRVIEEMAARIEKSKTVPDSVPGLNRDQVDQALKQRFLRQLLFDDADTEALLEQARILHMDIIHSHYLVAVYYFDGPRPDDKRLHNTVRSTLKAEQDILFDFTAGDQLALLLYGNGEEALNERVYRLVHILKHELKDLCPVITVALSCTVQRLGAIADAYKTAADLLKKVSSISPGQVINAADTAQITADIVNYDGPFSKEFRQSILRATPEEVSGLLDAAINGSFDSMLMRYYALIDIIKLAVEITTRYMPMANSKDVAARLSEKYNIFAASEDRETFRHTAEELLTDALSARQDAIGDLKYASVMSRAQKYVAENFCDPNISLITTARYVGMSAAHFSTVFSQTLGRSFINYLTCMRIDRAKELLRTTNMRLSDIALEIGYNEPNYFSHVFRKMEGITPKEYRAMEETQ